MDELIAPTPPNPFEGFTSLDAVVRDANRGGDLSFLASDSANGGGVSVAVPSVNGFLSEENAALGTKQQCG